MKELNVEMADVLEIDTIDDDTKLETFDSWDSLAMLSILAFIDSEYNVNLSTDDIADVKNLSDLKSIVISKLK
jgi:acyl carrier protein